MLNLFGKRQDWLTENFPPTNKHHGLSFNVPKATQWLMKHSFDAALPGKATNLKGTGVWQDEDDPDALIINLGAKIAKGASIYAIEDFADKSSFIRCNAEIVWPEDIGTIDDAHSIVDALETFAFEDPYFLDLVLGWIAVSFYCGALKWRPHLYVTAPRGSGKTTLMRLLEATRGCICFVAGQDATRAYLLQSVSSRAAAILIDEAEAGATNKIEDTIVLARHASDGEGACVGRGTPGGTAQNYFFAGVFCLLGIQSPQLKAQDQSRFAQISLKSAKEQGHTADQLDLLEQRIERLRKRSAHLLRFMVGRWQLFRCAERDYRKILQDDCGHTGRFSMQAAALLAGYDVLLLEEPRPHTDMLTRVQEMMPTLEAAMALGEPEPGELVLEYLASKVPQFLGADHRRSVAEMVSDGLQGKERSEARDLLRRIGLTFPRKKHNYIAVAHGNANLNDLFRGTAWENGAWLKLVQQLSYTLPAKSPIKSEGRSTRSTLVPLDKFLAPLEAE